MSKGKEQLIELLKRNAAWIFCDALRKTTCTILSGCPDCPFNSDENKEQLINELKGENK